MRLAGCTSFAAVGDEISALDRSAFRLDRKVGAEHLNEAVLRLRLEDLATIWARHLDARCSAFARPPARTPLLLRHSAQRRVDVGTSAGPREFAAAVARRLPAHPRVERVDGRRPSRSRSRRPRGARRDLCAHNFVAARRESRRFETMSEATGDWGSGAPPPEQPPPALPPVPPALPPLPPPSPAPPGGWPTPPPPSYPPAPPLEMTVTAIVGGSAMLPVVAVTLYALIMLVLRRKPWLFTLCDCSSCCSKRRPTLQVPSTQAQLSPRLNAAI